MIKCGRCNKRPAPITEYGPVYCSQCNQKLAKTHPGKLGGYPEFVPDRIKEDRKKHFKSTIQPYRQGIASKEFIEAYPEMAKKTFSDKERKKAKNVWTDLPNWQNRNKTT